MHFTPMPVVTQLPERGGSGNAQWPVWSPNGRQLAIQVNRLREHDGHNWIIDATTGDAHKLAAHDQPYLDEVQPVLKAKCEDSGWMNKPVPNHSI
jgi:hypothetical protein